MTHDQKHTLVSYLEGGTVELMVAMARFGIDGDPVAAREQLSDAIAQCPRCRRWRDAATMEDSGRCMDCEAHVTREYDSD